MNRRTSEESYIIAKFWMQEIVAILASWLIVIGIWNLVGV